MTLAYIAYGYYSVPDVINTFENEKLEFSGIYTVNINKNTKMANLTEHVMINKWDDDINSAIVEVGGDTSRSEGLPDYPDIIKTQLISNEAVGKGIYQDFLYVDEDKQKSIYPWEGESTISTNAPQSSIIADSIKQLYNTSD